MTTLDVVIPVRNTGRVFGLTMAHLYAYASPYVRSITICDNASDDPVLAAVLTDAAHRGCRVLRHERDAGVWCSLNRGLAATTADLVLVVTADVLIGPYLIPALVQAQEQTGVHYLAPEPNDLGLAGYDRVLIPPTEMPINYNYNGACWLLDWATLRKTVGWYDPQFYVCSGDTDYIARLALHAQATGDAKYMPHVVEGLYACHLDKQTRRADSAERDATIESTDLQRFRAKWAHEPDIINAHPVETMARKLQLRPAWEAGRL